MTDSTTAATSIQLNLANVPSGRIEADHLGSESALAGLIQLRARTDAQVGLAYVYLTPAQARGLRLQLSQALEVYYREHPEQLGADIERDLTMQLIPDLPQPADPCPICGGLRRRPRGRAGPRRPGRPAVPPPGGGGAGGGHDRISRSDCPGVSVDEAVQRG